MSTRDWDVFESISTLLAATNEFDNIYRSALPESNGQRSEDQLAACVAPRDWDEVDDADNASTQQIKRSVRWTLTLMVREDDPEIRERYLDRLLNIAMTAIDGKSLAGLTIPAWTKLRKGSYELPNAPEQRMTCQGEFVYWIDGFGSHDASS